MDRVAADVVGALRRDARADDGCRRHLRRPRCPFPSDLPPCGAGCAVAVDGAAKNGGGDGGDDETGDPVAREYRSRASAQNWKEYINPKFLLEWF